MRKLRIFLEENLKKDSAIYKIGAKTYRFLRSFGDFLLRVYLRVCDFFLPKAYFIQSKPDFVVKEYFPGFNKSNRTYAQKANRPVRDGTRLIQSKLLLDVVKNLDEGDYAELGTYRGNFARHIFEHKNENATLYCFDTFEGFDERDVNIEFSETQLKTKKSHFSDTSLDLVRNNITGDKKDERLELIKGYFPGTFEGLEDKKWRFVHLDADLYEPIKAGVQTFWPNIVKGGVLLVHDYNGAYVGTKKAVDEYFLPLGIVPVPLPDKVGSCGNYQSLVLSCISGHKHIGIT